MIQLNARSSRASVRVEIDAWRLDSGIRACLEMSRRAAGLGVGIAVEGIRKDERIYTRLFAECRCYLVKLPLVEGNLSFDQLAAVIQEEESGNGKQVICVRDTQVRSIDENSATTVRRLWVVDSLSWRCRSSGRSRPLDVRAALR